jgi:1-deoxy-D-xylulose-5-phosphate reductoisomerase
MLTFFFGSMQRRQRNIAILGSTGSIGRNALEIVHAHPEQFKATVLTARSNVKLLLQQIERFGPSCVVVGCPADADAVRSTAPKGLEVLTGESGLEQAVARPDVDVVMSSLVGFAGLRPTIAAIRHGKTIALANKETLVAGGQIIMRLLKKHSGQLIPVDSEHSAIFQCLVGEDPSAVAKLILTASGGPFRELPREKFAFITAEDALKHPNWSMGPKVTIDSATLMNKGLEVIEAHWLFGLPPEKITVVVHPQSIVHSMVEFVDGSIKAQLGLPDMKLPIQYALSFPERWAMNGERIDFPKLGSMSFSRPDRERFPCLGMAYEALEQGGAAPAVLNAANEVAVAAFLEGKIPFTMIPELIRKALNSYEPKPATELEHIIEADQNARKFVSALAY